MPSYHPIVVSALLPGRVEELRFLEGSVVEKGQLVARLYAKDLEDALALAKAKVATAQAELDLMTAGYRKEDVEKARHELERLGREADLLGMVAERTRALLPDGAASVEEMERDEAAARVAAAAAEAARSELRKLEAGYRVEEIARARAELGQAVAARDQAETRLSWTSIESPASGVVLERYVTPGTYLTPGNLRVVSLYDPGDLQARVDVRQENAGRVAIGQTVTLTTEAEPGKTYSGTVIRVEPLADLKKNTVQAKIRIEDPGPGLHPEMICRARFAEAATAPAPAGSAPAERVLTVPATAVLVEGGRSFVFRVEKGVARRVEIRAGEGRGGRIVVEAGVGAGDRVVVSPPADLADGDTVTEGGR